LKFETERKLLDLVTIASEVLASSEGGLTPYAPHPGDLLWWTCYLGILDDPEAENARFVGPLDAPAGWGFVSAKGGTVDAFTPQFSDGVRLAAYEEGLRELSGAGSAKTVLTWISEDDGPARDWASLGGFEPSGEGYTIMTLELGIDGSRFAGSGRARAAKSSTVSKGDPLILGMDTAFAGALVEGPAFDGESRALAQRSAFGASMPVPRYLERFALFRSSLAWNLGIDVTLGPAPEVLAFARVWPDALSGVALLEPLGVREDAMGRGLGRAVLSLAARAACRSGMRSLRVAVEMGNERAAALYKDFGFTTLGEIPTLARTRDK